MKNLIVYYSRSGSTRFVAEKLKAITGADLEEIRDNVNRAGIIGYLRSGREAFKKTIPEIEDSKLDPAVYDLVIIGTPVWVGTMASPVRAYLEKNKGRIKKTAWFATQGSSQRQKAFDEMTRLYGQAAATEIFITTREARTGNCEKKLLDFVAALGG